MEMSYEDSAKVFKALCDEKRLEIIEKLRTSEKCACVLLDQMDIGQSGLSYHMKILCDSGLVNSRQKGKWTHYTLSESGRDRAVELLKELTTPTTSTDVRQSCCDR